MSHDMYIYTIRFKVDQIICIRIKKLDCKSHRRQSQHINIHPLRMPKKSTWYCIRNRK